MSNGFSGFGGNKDAPPPLPTAAPPAQGATGPVAAAVTRGRALNFTPLTADAMALDLDRTGFLIRHSKDRSNRLVDDHHEVCLDGVCPFDPTDAQPTKKALLWSGATRRKDLDFSAATALSTPVGQQQRGGAFEIATSGGIVVIPAQHASVIEVAALFVPKIVMLHGEDGQPRAPDYPVAANWLPAIRSCEKTVSPAGDQASYRVELHGLRGTINLSYSGDDVAIAGEPRGNTSPGNHLRIMAWPKNAPKGWKLFVVDVGAPYNRYQWAGQFKWSLLHRPDGDEPFLKAIYCTEVRLNSQQPGKEIRDVFNENRASSFYHMEGYGRVASAERPDYLEVSGAEDKSGGLFKFNFESRGLKDESTDWGLDVGTSNSCLTLKRKVAGSEVDKTLLVDFNQLSGAAGPGQAGLQIDSVIGHATKPRCHLHWMPGLEGAATADLWDESVRTQIPSRLIVLRENHWESLSKSDLQSLIPMLDVVLPPLAGRRSLGNDSVDKNTVDKLKWIQPSDDKMPVLLAKYVANVLVLAASREATTSTVNVKYSVPLAFDNDQSKKFNDAVKSGCEQARELTGIRFNAAKSADESRCIAMQFVKGFDTDRVPLWVICDIGGGSVDVAVATATKKDLTAPDSGATLANGYEHSFAVLAADSVKFGAELVMDAVIRIAGKELAPKDSDPAVIRQAVRERLNEVGLEKMVTACSPSIQARICDIVWIYYYLLAEYVARIAAGSIRNQQRLLGFMAADIKKGGYQISGLDPIDVELQLEILITGNGFRTFDAIRARRSDTRIINDFADLVRDRVMKLIVSDIPEYQEETAWFRGVPALESTGHRGLYVPDLNVRLLKEAQAYAILSTGAMPMSEEDFADLLSCPNGISEFQEGRKALGVKGINRPWYAFVGSRKVIMPQLHASGAKPFEMPDDDHWFVSGASVARTKERFGPGWPSELQQRAATLAWDLDLNNLYEKHSQDIKARMAGQAQAGHRASSLLRAIYEAGIARHFSP